MGGAESVGWDVTQKLRKATPSRPEAEAVKKAKGGRLSRFGFGRGAFNLRVMSQPEKDLKPRTKAFTVRIIGMYSDLPKHDPVAEVLGKQGLRSGTSVGANYREASRGRSRAEFISKIGDCLKEIEETEYWLELLVVSGRVGAVKMAALLDETRQLSAIFTTIDKRSKDGL